MLPKLLQLKTGSTHIRYVASNLRYIIVWSAAITTTIVFYDLALNISLVMRVIATSKSIEAAATTSCGS